MTLISPDFTALLDGVGQRGDDPEVLNEVCRACVDELGVDGAGMTVILDGRPQGRLGVSDPRSAAVEDLQFTAGHGPCLDAYATGQVVSEPALAETSKWPGFAPGAVQRGLGAVFAFPLQRGRARFGALDVYLVKPAPLPVEVYADVALVSHSVTSGLLTMMAGSPPGWMPSAMDGVVADRAVVHMAAGMVSVQMQASIEDALVALRARAYATGATITEIATQVVDHRLRFDDEDGAS